MISYLWSDGEAHLEDHHIYEKLQAVDEKIKVPTHHMPHVSANILAVGLWLVWKYALVFA